MDIPTVRGDMFAYQWPVGAGPSVMGNVYHTLQRTLGPRTQRADRPPGATGESLRGVAISSWWYAMRYRKISIQIWNDAKFRLLSDDAKLLFFFLLTHPHMTSIGAMRGTPQGLAAELGWLPERLSKGFREGCLKGMVKYDESASCIWLPNFVKHNKPESPNVIKSWGSAFELIPECVFRSLIYNELRRVTEGMGEAFTKAFRSLSEDFGKAMPNQEQEQEQEQDNQIPPLSPPQPEGDLFPDDGESVTVSCEPTKVEPIVGGQNGTKKKRWQPIPKNEFEERAVRFWDAWPNNGRRVDQRAIFTWFDHQQISEEDLQEMFVGMSHYLARERDNENYKYVPEPIRFLRKRGWEAFLDKANHHPDPVPLNGKVEEPRESPYSEEFTNFARTTLPRVLSNGLSFLGFKRPMPAIHAVYQEVGEARCLEALKKLAGSPQAHDLLLDRPETFTADYLRGFVIYG